MTSNIHNRIARLYKSAHISKYPWLPIAHTSNYPWNISIISIDEYIHIVDGGYKYLSVIEFILCVGSPAWFLVLAVYFDWNGDSE